MGPDLRGVAHPHLRMERRLGSGPPGRPLEGFVSERSPRALTYAIEKSTYGADVQLLELGGPGHAHRR